MKTTKKLLARAMVLVMVMCMMFALAVPASALDHATEVDDVRYGVFKFNWTFADISESRGTAFLINDDTIVTAAHCVMLNEAVLEANNIRGTTVEELQKAMRYSVTVERDMTVEAELLTYSENMDFAILKLKQTIPTRKYLVLRDSKEMKAGETVFSVGFPAFYDNQQYDSTYTIDDVTVKTGVVSKVQGFFDEYSTDGHHWKCDMLSTTCQISGGDSGGPMIDENGYVVGVSVLGFQSGTNTAFYSASAIDQVIRACDNLDIEYTLSTDVSTEPAATEATQPTETEAPKTTETEASEPTETEAAQPTETETETSESTETQGDIIDETDSKADPTMLILIIAAAAVVVIVVVVLIVVSAGKNKKQATPTAQASAGRPAGATTGFAPVTPAQPQHTAPMSPESNATTVLTADANATTVLAQNGGILTRKKNGETIKVNTASFVIGRERKNVNYCISDNSNISRMHAKLTIRNGVVYLSDLNAANGTYVNGVKVIPNQEIALKTGDKIMLADEELEYKI